MKKVYLFIGLALSMLAVGCSSDSTGSNDTPVVPEGDVTVTVNATLAHEGLVWHEGDVVSINGASATVANEGKTATLVVADVEAPLLLVAPASGATGLNEITLRGVQNYVEGGYDASAYVLYGGAATTTPVEGVENAYTADIAVTTASGVVSLPLTLDPATAENPVAIKSISLVSLDGAPLCGTFEVRGSIDAEGNLVGNVQPAEVSNVLDLVSKAGVEISVDTPVYFNFVVPAGVYTKGFELEIVDTENHHYLATTTLTAPVLPEPELPETPETPEESEPVAPASTTVEAGVVAPASTTTLEPVVFTVVEKGPATLTVTIGEEAIKWVEGDAIVVNEELSSEVAAEAVGTSTATFNLTDVAYPYSVFYPAELYTTSGSLRFADQQPLVAGGYDRSLLAMVGYSTGNEVTLKNLCGVVTIPITNLYEGENIVLESLTITSAQGDPIAGKYHINYRDGKVSAVTTKSSIVLTNGSADEDGVVITPQETVRVSFVVPAGSVRNGLKLSILSNMGLVEDVELFKTGLDVRGGEEKIAETYEYKEIKIDAIRTADELLDFAKCVNMGRYKKYINEEEGGAVILGADIDMSTLSETWAPIVGKVDETTGLPLGFDGIFDGKGYKITNWATMQPLFGYLGAGATVKNFVIDASCNLIIPEVSIYSSDGKPTSNLCFGFAVASNLAGNVENITNNADVTCVCPDDTYAQSRAAIVGYNAPGGFVRNCINNGAITFDLANHTAQTAYIGTVVARAQSGADTVPAGLYNLENHGKLTINITDGKTNKNFYIGGISGSANSYTVVEGCKNYADVTYNINNDVDMGALVCMGGVIGYSAGDITNCYNEGNVTFDGLCKSVYSGGVGDFRGSIAAGIVGYQNAALTNCINKGDITITGNRFGGRNSLGGIDGKKSKSSAAPAVAGIVGYCYKATVDGCENYGKITYHQPNGDASGTSGIHLAAGVVASTWGNVTNCKNFGEIEVVRKYATANVNSYLYVGGIAASDYYPLTQNESSIIDCVNEGNITVDNDLGTSNSAYGGIVGWPGWENAGQTNVTERCVNKGNLVINGNAKARVGGLHGGSGSIIDCQNFGSLTVNNSHADSCYGGLSGFHTQTQRIIGSTNTGDVIVNVSLTGTATGVGGMIGGRGNVAVTEGQIAGNKVKCTVRAVDAGHGVGMLVGHFNGNKVMYIGTEDSPIEVAGTLKIGDTETVIDATNFDSLDLLCGGCKNFDDTKHLFTTVLAQ